jgi:dihydrolipoamide dehydrogenase
MDSYDLVVIGSGPGGYVAALRASQLGMKTALVEKDARLGGTCLNVGCIPSKALLESSEQFHAARHKFASFGIQFGSVDLDLPTMMARKDRIVTELTDGVALLAKNKKVAVLKGRGSLGAPGRVRVAGEGGETEVEAKHVVLALGSTSVQLPFLPFDGKRVVTSTEALSFDAVPDRLVVIGAGAIGLELGSVWNRLGSRVTVVELLPRIAPFADAMMSRFLDKALRAQGMDLRTSIKVTGAKVTEKEVVLSTEDAKGQAEELAADVVLVAVGRKPFTEGAGLKEAGVELDEKGRIRVGEHFQTSVPNVYAIGDVIPGPMLAHKASEEGVACVERIAGKAGHVNYDAVPNVIYTWPELAQVGKTEEELKAEKVPIKVGRFYFAANGRAKSLGEEEGLVKVIAHAETDRLLGVHIVGPRASDMIAEAALAMEFKASAEDLARTVAAHPTLAEVMKEAALAVDKQAIHA